MKVITKTVLYVDPKKPGIPAGKEIELKKEIAEDLLKRSLVDLPVASDAAGDHAMHHPGD